MFTDRLYIIVLVTHITFVVAIKGGNKSLSEFIVRLSDFEQIKALGSGSCDWAWLGRDIRTGDVVAVNVMPKKPSNKQDRRMFTREVKILASVDHPTLL
jgi:serine/threonine protein kinase